MSSIGERHDNSVFVIEAVFAGAFFTFMALYSGYVGVFTFMWIGLIVAGVIFSIAYYVARKQT